MAAPGSSEPGWGPARYCLVSHIPAELRSAQLRSYFSQFAEAGGFLCFHYRHRPERSGPPGQGPATCCCLVAVRPGQARRLVRMYSGKRWLDAQGDGLPGRCVIRRVRVSPGTGLGMLQYKTKKELHNKTQSETFTQADLKWLPELNPPVFMPHGNVGTPLRVFLELIKACRLPPRVIKKLQLRFPKTGSSRRYGNVPFKYQDTETVEQEDLVYTDTGEEITMEKGHLARTGMTQTSDEEDWEGPGKEEAEESHSDDDDDRCEECERHEALHEDVTSQERTEERLYEEEIELKWEKGGSGLVFYTDAQYWQEEQGDFDEQTADDWDVDMSIYYDKGIALKLSALCPHLSRYHGEKLQTFNKPKKPRRDGPILISTIYDEPQPVDGGDQLLRCQLPTAMKYRQDMAFVRATQSAHQNPSGS
ncbi:LOW QUALITY PROTEIN: G patch domain-containing protein 3 [Gopherus flavomarginatus]|uniref:LOW QUALITY PROTEIN: G patch domain-containing protein 3 n=1 Tax=Gopherus flavomarginatus TaxID=286002 RepID=UPI0021CBCB18|nr:LOW QUALITY PROTEIN: G patch domain-containing protein 3 [Gopherus flavomarginatus]